MRHDHLCELATEPCCPWIGDCACQCTCDRIEQIREDERRQAMEAVAKMDLREMSPHESKIAALAWMDGRQTCIDHQIDTTTEP